MAIIIDDDSLRQDQEFKLYALFVGAVDFPFIRRHLFAGPTIEQDRVFSTLTQGDPNAVDGGVTTADNTDLLAHAGRLAHVGFTEELDTTGEETLVALVLPFDTCRLRLMRARRNQHGVVLLFQLHQADVLADMRIVLDLDSHLANDVDIPLQDVARHPVSRDTDGDHATAKTFRQRFVDGAVIAFEGQVVSGGQTGRAGTDNSDFLFLLRLRLHRRLEAVLPLVIGSGPLEHHDVDRIIDVGPATGGLARVRTNPAANSWQRHTIADDLQCLAEAALFDRFDVGGDIDMGRAFVLTGSGHLDFQINRFLLFPGAVDVVKIIGTEVLHRIGNRNPRGLTQGAFAVLHQIGNIHQRIEILFLAVPFDNPGQGILHHPGAFFTRRAFCTAVIFLHPLGVLGSHRHHINIGIFQDQSIPTHKCGNLFFTAKCNRQFLLGDFDLRVAALPIIDNLSSPAGKSNL